MIEYRPPSKNVCDLDNCFAHSDKSDTCTLLKRAVKVNCPFYKPIKMKNGHKIQSAEWHNDKADEETRRYAKKRIEKLTKEIKQLNKEIKEREEMISEASGWK